VRQKPSKWETGTVWLVKNHTETLLDDRDWEGFLRQVKCSSMFVEGIALSSLTHGLRRPREDCTPGKPQIKVSISWTTKASIQKQ